jgi:hypothetical protein
MLAAQQHRGAAAFNATGQNGSDQIEPAPLRGRSIARLGPAELRERATDLSRTKPEVYLRALRRLRHAASSRAISAEVAGRLEIAIGNSSAWLEYTPPAADEAPPLSALRIEALLDVRRFEDATAVHESNPQAARHLPPWRLRQLQAYIELRDLSGLKDDEIILAEVAAVAASERRIIEPEPGRLAFLVNSLDLGGSELRGCRLAAVMHERGRAVDLVVSRRGSGAATVPPGVSVRLIQEPDAQASGFLGELTARRRLVRLCELLGNSSLPKTMAALAASRAECAHFLVGDMEEAMLAAHLSGLPRLLLQFGGMPPELNDPIAPARAARRHEFVCRAMKAGAAGSGVGFAANSLAAAVAWGARAGIDPDRISIIGNGVDLVPAASRAGQAVRSRMGIPPEAVVVGSAFRLAAVKDPDLWLKTAGQLGAILPEAHFILLGDGPLMARLRKTADENGLGERVHFAGLVGRNIADFYAAMGHCAADVALRKYAQRAFGGAALRPSGCDS